MNLTVFLDHIQCSIAISICQSAKIFLGKTTHTIYALFTNFIKFPNSVDFFGSVALEGDYFVIAAAYYFMDTYTLDDVPIFAWGVGLDAIDGQTVENTEIARIFASLMSEDSFGDPEAVNH